MRFLICCFYKLCNRRYCCVNDEMLYFQNILNPKDSYIYRKNEYHPPYDSVGWAVKKMPIT